EIAQMRALETGKPLLRATNTGVTAVVDHQGQIIAELPQFETGVLRATVTPTKGLTPYTTLGSWPLYLYLLWSVAVSWLLIKRRRGDFRDTSPQEGIH
ncbi:MAG: nitrilase-related carbon-nitrogen hydrolase, partial [Photobacterium halotolerans]